MAGKEVLWKSSAGKETKGKITDAHGTKGLVRAIFERGLPGQAITTEIEIIGKDQHEEKKRDLKNNNKEKNN